MRLFIAINFPDEVRARLLELQSALRWRTLAGNFSRPENLHLTLAFLGETPAGRIQAVKGVMERADSPPFSLCADTLGHFGSTWWCGLRHCPPLLDCQRRLAQALRGAGFPVEQRPFTPHLTLAREVELRPDADIPTAFAPILTEAAGLSLMKSERIAGKLTYTELYTKRFS